MKTLAPLLFLILMMVGVRSWAFPEMIRHGYQSCTTCHYSPTGGGAPTPYGRSLSKELMSTWGYEGEENAFYSLENEERPWDVGGNIRFLQFYLSDEQKEKAEFFPMQMDLELVFKFQKWVAAGVLGMTRERATVEKKKEFLSRRYYVMYQATDQLAIRTGRFYPQFGIMSPDHARFSRRNLGFNNGNETLNLEASYLSETTEIFATAVFDQLADNYSQQRDGGVLSVARIFGNYKIGLSGLRFTDEISEKTIGALWGQLGFTEKFYLLTELDRVKQRSLSSLAETTSWVTTNVLGYEVMKGLVPYLAFEWEDLSTSGFSQVSRVYGVGAQWLPRPHIELKLELQDRDIAGVASQWAYLMMHYYL